MYALYINFVYVYRSLYTCVCIYITTIQHPKALLIKQHLIQPSAPPTHAPHQVHNT